MLVVADTAPLNYLVLIGRETILPQLFSRIIPAEVRSETSRHEAPARVARWAATLPAWVEVKPPQMAPGTDLDPGEEAAIALAVELHADAVLIDEKLARRKTRSKGIEVIGTVGVLILAARRRLLDLDEALDHLEKTSAFLGGSLMDMARRAASEIGSKSGGTNRR